MVVVAQVPTPRKRVGGCETCRLILFSAINLPAKRVDERNRFQRQL